MGAPTLGWARASTCDRWGSLARDADEQRAEHEAGVGERRLRLGPRLTR